MSFELVQEHVKTLKKISKIQPIQQEKWAKETDISQKKKHRDIYVCVCIYIHMN